MKSVLDEMLFLHQTLLLDLQITLTEYRFSPSQYAGSAITKRASGQS
jgi:hypothetical protein